VSAAFLYQAWELRSFRAIVAEQLRTDALYGSATYARFFPYKLELARTRRAPVLVLGSSTMMAVREQAFRVPMTNAAGGLRYINEGQLFLRELLKTYRPDVVLLGVDFWWFHPAYVEPPDYAEHGEDADSLTFFKLIDPWVRLGQREVSGREFARVLGGRHDNGITGFDHLGLLAIHSGTGFRRDGSILYGKLFFGLMGDAHADVQFAATLGEIRDGADKFRHGAHVDPVKLAEFRDLVEAVRAQGVRVVLLVPPLPPQVFDRMRSLGPAYGYVNEMKRAIARLDVEAYDFQGGDDVVSDACEFFDGFHGGDVVLQRILLAIADRHPDSALRPYLDLDALRLATRRFAGRVLSPFEPGKYPLPEVDFVRLGCNKSFLDEKR
jgi:hypothetical protein